MGKVLFGTDGIRGTANVYPMTGEIAMALGRAVTSYFQNSKNHAPVIVIGKDTRLSCYMLEQAFVSGVCSQGGRAIMTGPLPTPGVAFVTQSMRADAGVMISASHNDFEDNGIKLFDAEGNKLPDSVEMELEHMVLNPSRIESKIGAELGRAQRLDEVMGRYIVFVKSAFPSNYNLEGLKIVVDAANGAAYKIAPLVFRELGAEVIEVGNHPNGTNINLGCGALHPELCSDMVKKYGADLGVCLDGDADRIMIIDGEGDLLHGDKLIAMCAHYLKDIGGLGEANEVVGTIMSNLGIEKYLQSLGINFFRANVGDRYIIERMKKKGSLFGGEPSGHVVFKSFSTTGDGILSALKVIECAKYYGKTLKQLSEDIKLYPQKLVNVRVKEKIPFLENPTIHDVVEEVEQELGDKGRLVLRYSGTEPKARVMVEAETDEMVNKAVNRIVDVIKAEIGE